MTDLIHLMSEIEKYFPFVDKPKGKELSFHPYSCWKCNDLREELEPFCEQQLPVEAIRSIHQELSRLSAKGWRWILPSFLRYAVSKEAAQSQMEIEFLIYELGPDKEFQEEVLERLSMMSQNQIDCLILFLQWCQLPEQSQWSTYCPKEIKKALNFLKQIQKH